MNIERFLEAYITAALWSSVGDNDALLDDQYSADNLAPDTVESMWKDCEDFIAANAEDLEAYGEQMESEQWSAEDRAGHDFWLTRNGHGAGFWDRGLEDLGERLSKAAKVYGSSDLYVGDDGLLYVS